MKGLRLFKDNSKGVANTMALPNVECDENPAKKDAQKLDRLDNHANFPFEHTLDLYKMHHQHSL